MHKLFLILAFTPLALAQTGQITGVVTDTSGAAVPKATIELTSPATGLLRRLETNAQGDYTAPLLQPGIYSVSVQASGFRPMNREDIKLEVDRVVRIDFVLQVGPVSEKLTITATTPLLETKTASTGQVIESKQCRKDRL